jgi:hypothetical protein
LASRRLGSAQAPTAEAAALAEGRALSADAAIREALNDRAD